MTDEHGKENQKHDSYVYVSDSKAEEGKYEHFKIYLNDKADYNFKVYYETEDGHGPDGAKAGQDYKYTKGFVEFHKGDKWADVYVPTYEDKKYEGTEKFYLKIS